MVYLKNEKEVSKRDFFIKLKSAPISERHYYQVPMGFDIETTSYTRNGEKRGTMYIWQICYLLDNDYFYVYGRTWDEFEDFIYSLRKTLSITPKQKFVIYVHNLSFEFQWIYTHIRMNKVFARKPRHPISCENRGLIFKCSYFLSNYSLRSLAKERGYKEKENMDYSKKRLSCTPLDDNDLHYALVDVRIIAEYIRDEIKKNGTIEDIPLTSTGYARRYCIDYISEHENFLSYQNRVKEIIPQDEELFYMLYDGYAGGFTHANYINAGIVLEDVSAIDYTSSYPAVMCRKRFPMRFHKADPNPRKLFLYKDMAQIMTVKFVNIKAKTSHSIISFNKCKTVGEQLDNGRIREAKELTITITDLDYKIYEMFYDWDKEKSQIETLYVAQYKYLPRNLIMAILELYKNKTTLKGVIGMEEAYLRAKELINAVYGMSVTNPINDEIIFDYGEWEKQPTDVVKGLNKYHSGKNLFTAYQWGVWVTAWARYELLSTVYKIGNDVVYCDTDSIKYLNNHDDIVKADNERIALENKEIMSYYKIDEEFYSPKTIKGKTKTLGLWDVEAPYKYFKTLGAKRYVYSYYDDYFESIKDDLETDENFFITIAGLPKVSGKEAILKLAEEHNVSPFDIFSFEDSEISDSYCMEIKPEYAGKSVFSYHNETFDEIEKDYLGNECEVYETSFVHVEPTGFTLGTTEEFLSLLRLVTVETNMGGVFTDPRKGKIKWQPRQNHNTTT